MSFLNFAFSKERIYWYEDKRAKLKDMTNLLEIVTSLLVGKLWLRKDLSNKLEENKLPITGIKQQMAVPRVAKTTIKT